MEPRTDARTRRQDESGGGSQIEGRTRPDQHTIERLLSRGDQLGLAPAKINLFLHVGAPAPDGYHPVCSLVTFADIGDQLRLDDRTMGRLVIDGPFAADLDAGADNLVMKACHAVLEGIEAERPGFRLTKNLPLASGIGGGSADAAAALRLLTTRMTISAHARIAIARSLGSDVPACLESKPVLTTGRGERLEAPPKFPALDAVLVNPGVASPTAGAYRAYDIAPSPEGPNRAWPSAELRTSQDTARFLAGCRNDLEAPAIGLTPQIGQVLELLRRQPEALMARMSGSGATCFALVEDAKAAAELETRVRELRPDWWIRRTTLQGSP